MSHEDRMDISQCDPIRIKEPGAELLAERHDALVPTDRHPAPVRTVEPRVLSA